MPHATERYSISPIALLGQRKKKWDQRGLFRRFLPHLDAGASVLEIGPGRGLFARECLQRNLHYLGIEPSVSLRRALLESGISAIEGTVPPIPKEDGLFDLVHSHDFLEHLHDSQEALAFFLESFRVLKPGGYISVLAPNYLTLQQLFYRYEYQHTFVTTCYRLTQLARDAGFEVVRSVSFLWFLAPGLRCLDRLFARTLIPLANFSLLDAMASACLPERVLFGIHKNLYDHVGVLARKPAVNSYKPSESRETKGNDP